MSDEPTFNEDKALEAAMSLPTPAEQEAALEAAFGIDDDVQERIEKLLVARGQSPPIAVGRPHGGSSPRTAAQLPSEEPGQTFGHYTSATADVNNDDRPDIVTANLGKGGAGSISVLLAKSDGGFETPRTFNASGALFAISVADFDNDGNMDVVAGRFDCHVEFLNGDGKGNFIAALTPPVPFVNESRVMVTG